MLLLVIITAIISGLAISRQLSLTEPEQVMPAEDHQQNFDAAIRCAATLAATESVDHGELTPGSDTFRLVGYTLGMAQEHAMKAGMDLSRVKSLYDQKVVKHYMQLAGATPDQLKENRGHYDRCIEQARHYDPDTMLDAALRDAQKREKGK